jgi:antitoxin YefM
MSSINVTNARKQLYKIIQDVNESHEPVHIISKKGSVVMVSEEDWKSIEETLYVTSIPGLRDSIIAGLNEPLDNCSDNLDW